MNTNTNSKTIEPNDTVSTQLDLDTITPAKLFGFIYRKLLSQGGYDSVYEPENGFAILEKGGKFGFFCIEDNTICEPEYDAIANVDMGENIRVRKGDVWGYVHYGDMKFYLEDDEDSWPEDELFYAGAD